ncbi:MAG: cobalamin B12-binding domain-containing protein [Xanthomonadales bacterium]|nr:cobalamin B12-binding domain-containing protein [Xanthomonadales bacterium]
MANRPSDRDSRPDRGTSGDTNERELDRLIRGEVIPRLMMAYASSSDVPSEQTRVADLSSEMIQDFSQLIVDGAEEQIMAFVDEVLQRGVPLNSLFMDIFAPAARLLGERWSEDTLDFSSVTLGLVRLQQQLRRLAPKFYATAPANPEGRVFLTTLPQEHHTFGLLMVGEFFRQAGWEVHDDLHKSSENLVQRVRDNWYSAIGISLSSESRMQELSDLLRSIRSMSANPNVGIMVGGWLFCERPDLVEFAGADFGADSPEEAITAARQWVAQHASP